MDEWIWPAYIAIPLGIGLFALIFVPAVVVQMRRYGRLSWARILGAAAVAIYAVALVAYTMLPLPSGDLAQWCALHGVSGVQSQPLQFISDIRRDTDGLAMREMLTNRTTLQVILNVALFVPFGVFVRRYLGRGIAVATLGAFAVSVLIEATQWSGLWGLIGCSYRVADVDDVIANTAGGFIGAIIAPVVLAWMPQSRQLRRKRLLPRPVTAWRRWLGMAIDAFIFTALAGVLTVMWRVALQAGGAQISPSPYPWWQWLTTAALAWVAVFVVPLAGSGASWGQRAVWLRPAGPQGGYLTGGRKVARSWSLGGVWGACQAVQLLPSASAEAADLLNGLATLVAIIAVISVLFSKDRRGLSGLVASSGIVDARGQGSQHSLRR